MRSSPVVRLAAILAATCSTLTCVAWMACVPAGAATRTLKLGYILSDTSQLGAGAAAFAAEVAKRTEGRYRIEDYPDAMLGGEIAVLRDLKLGAIDLAFVTGVPLPKILPAVGIFNIPFLFRSPNQARAVLDGPIGDTYLRAFDGAGLVALAWGENGMRHLTNSKRPVRSPDDLVGLKVRLPQSDVMAAGFRALGAEVEQTPFPDAYGALQSGRLDAEENSIATIEAANFAQVQHFLTLTAHAYDPAVILMSQDAYDALPDADKRAFRDAARLGGRASRTAADEAERTGIADLKAKGMVVVETIDRAAFAAKVEDVAPTYDREFGRDAIEAIRAYGPPPSIGSSAAIPDGAPAP